MKYFAISAAFAALLTPAPGSAADVERAINIVGIVSFAGDYCPGWMSNDRRLFDVVYQTGVTIDEIDSAYAKKKIVDVVMDLKARQKKTGVSCAAAVSLFGPNGKSIRNLIIER